MSNTFVTSDTHFGHKNIIRLCDRPFASVEEMDETMIDRWNEVVRPNDIVWHLGDFAYKLPGGPHKIFNRLNGSKYFITGNHDPEPTLKLGWVYVNNYVEMDWGPKFVLFHYPMVEWNHFYRGAIHCHGHQHNKEALRAPRRVDVGVDANDFRPWAVEELVELVKE